MTDSLKNNVSIGICGVGGGGGNAVKSVLENFNTKNQFNILDNDFNKIKFVVANTDAQALAINPAPYKIQLGANLTKGFGAGGLPIIGEKSAIESKDEIIKHLSSNDLIFITCGMGGGTGTGATPMIAQYLQEMKEEIVKQYGEYNEFPDYLKIAIVTTPFNFEGRQKMQIAKKGIEELKKYVDTLIVIPNQNLFRIANEKTTLMQSFYDVDKILRDAINCLLNMIIRPGIVNVDFADIRNVISRRGRAVIGIGSSNSNDDRAIEAATNAMYNPILDQVSFKKAKALLVSITGGDDLTLFEIDSALNRISEEIDDDADIIFGSVYDPDETGNIIISIIATGIDDEESSDTNKINLSDQNNLNNKNQSYNKLFGIFNKDESTSKSENIKANEKKEDLEEKKLNIDQKSDNNINTQDYYKSIDRDIDLVINEKLQKLGIYDDLKLQNQRNLENNFHQNNNINGYKNNQKDKILESNNIDNNKKSSSNSIFSKIMSDIPAYLKKKKKD